MSLHRSRTLLMQQGNVADKLSTEPPNITADDFEDYLLTDDLLVDYFNTFLALLNFPMPIWFNKVTETFEVVDDAKKNLLKKLKGLVQALSPHNPIYDVTIKSKRKYSQSKQKITNLDVKFEDTYVVMCLDQEQGIAWIKNERLPAFLQSDCYFEYRLAKLLSQLECSPGLGMPHIDPEYHPWAVEIEESQVENILMDISYKEQSSLISMQRKASDPQTEVMVTEAGEEFLLPNAKSGTEIVAEMLQHPTGVSVNSPVSESCDVSKLETQNSRDKSSRVKANFEQESCNSSFSKPRIVDDSIFEYIPNYDLEVAEIISFEHKWESKVERMQEERTKDQKSPDTHSIVTGLAEQVRTDEATTKVNGSVKEIYLPSTLDETKRLDGNTQIDPKSNTSQAAQVNVEKSLAGNIIKTRGLSEGMRNKITESDSSSEEDDTKNLCNVTLRHGYDFKSRNGIENFKKFLQGTAGEKYWWLWMDIERLKVTKHGRKKQRYLNKIRSRYLFSGGEYCMNAEVHARLGLSFISQWTVENLCKTQSDVVAPLLLYWGPRYFINQQFPIRHVGIVLKDWQDRQLRPEADVGPFTVSPLDQIKIVCIPKEKCPPKNHKRHQSQWKIPMKRQLPKRPFALNAIDSPHSHQEGKGHVLMSKSDSSIHISKSMQPFEDLALRRAKVLHSLKTMQITKYHEALCDHKIDDLLHALHNESRTGYFFTDFCKKIENELWSNGVDLWFELKEYQRLFYAEAFQPFKLKRQAQFIFATYAVEGAPADVKMDPENRKIIYNKLEPPYEELFDQLEEHVLILLLVPWVKMLEMDTSKYQKVNLITTTRHLHSKYCKKLRELQRKSFPNKDFSSPAHSASLMQNSEELKNSSNWQTVPEEFRDYTFEGLLRNRLLLENFQDFLKENLAGLDLKCWLDIEKYRKIPKDEKESRGLKSKEIIKKYLNNKYFFGPISPATKAQQEEVVMLAGGQEKLLLDPLSLVIGTELQNYAKARLERKWLPKFLASPEFTERNHIRVQVEDVVEDQMIEKNKKKRELMKRITNKWIISFKEIITFRKALLNPVTALQFQKFVSLKGNLMENNVVFWLEVQKYKDLYHSHASEEMIQNKISVINNCFINSNIPPAVQIDIPLECAQKIISHGKEQGPYIFREAQMAVFDALFQLWPAFSEFRQRLEIDAILPALRSKGMSEQDKKNKFPMAKSSTEKMETSRDLSSTNTSQPHYLEIDSRSTGSQLSLKGGSGKSRKDHKIIKSESERDSQQAMLPDGPRVKLVLTTSETRFSGQFQSHGQKLSWSFSKYMEALARERALILREHKLPKQEPLPARTVATLSGTSRNDNVP
ncbi:regulator of G-protein signaling 22-like isoform X2 [Narcine bancroftii]|uniref:regulator of G-protein signaling 22-like isoform X2 n=1 Tax=Narcine bancroftii TaxID=1343680 RepID=UPI0038314F07